MIESRLTLVRYDDASSPGGRMATFRCQCGTEKRIRANHVKSGRVRSCGCLASELASTRSLKHGHTVRNGKTRHSRTYQTWSCMRKRCANPNDKRFLTYGARGIRVCDRWHSFENFLADMGEKPDGSSIDRIDNDGNYEPGNCRWVLTREEQMRNRTSTVLCETSASLIRHMVRRGSRRDDVAHAFGVSIAMVSYIVRGENWK